MPGFTAIAAASKALEQLLDRSLAAAFPAHERARAKLVTTDELRQLSPSSKLLSIFLLRIEPNLAARQSPHNHSTLLDLHYLLTPWGPDAAFEQTILGRALQCLHDAPTLPVEPPDPPVHLIPSNLPFESMIDLLPAVRIDYRPSIMLLLRGLRLDAPRPLEADRPPPAELPAAPYRSFSAFNYTLSFTELGEAPPKTIAGFSDLSGLPAHTHSPKVQGFHTLGEITLKRGLISSDDLRQWVADRPRTITITLLDEHHAPAASWTLHHAMPVKLAPADLNAQGSEVAIEELRLTHEGLEPC